MPFGKVGGARTGIVTRHHTVLPVPVGRKLPTQYWGGEPESGGLARFYRYRGFRATYTMDSHCGPLCFSESGPTDSHCGLKLYCTVLRYCMVPVVRSTWIVQLSIASQVDSIDPHSATVPVLVPVPVPPTEYGTAGLKVGQLTPTVE